MTDPVIQGEVAITCNGQSISAWSEVRITRSLRRFSDFEASLTEKYPNSAKYVVLAPFQPITVSISNGTDKPDLILTGYVDRYCASIAPGSHNITITGRSKCEDLQDCSAADGTSRSNIGLLDYATLLAKPYGIAVSMPKGSPILYPVLASNLTQTPKELIQMVAAYSQMIMYDDVNGNLVLSTVGAGSMGSGVTEGVNIQAGSVELSGDRRFQKYVAVLNSTSQTLQVIDVGNNLGTAYDKEVPRFRLKVFMGQMVTTNAAFGQQAAQWQANHNLGDSKEVTLIVDSWRDSNGKLWEPNWFCVVDSPSLKVINDKEAWIIADVTYKRDLASGTTAELRLSPKEAFMPEPIAPINPTLGIVLGPPGATTPPAATPAKETFGPPAPGGTAQVPGGAPT